MKRRLVYLVATAIIVAGGGWGAQHWFLNVDRCLDAGGSWNHQTDRCDR